jgi:glycosyltransferase involved in cell wall biosynthesis
MSRRRVLHVVTRLAMGGAQKSTLDTCVRLAKDRWDVEVLAGPEVGEDGSLQEAFTEAGIPVHLLPGLHREESVGNDLSALWRMIGFLRRGRYDVVHTHMAKAGIIGRMAAGYVHVPAVVHTAHGWPWHNFLDRKTKERYVSHERRAARKTGKIIVTSERDRGKALAWQVAPVDRFELVRTGIDFDLFDPARHDKAAGRRALGIPEDAPVVISVGALTPQKNPLEALEVIGRVRHAFPALHYVLVGDGPLRGAVQRQAGALGLGESFHFLSVRNDVPALLAAADVFLLTSKWEGLPRTLIEAMAMGKAPVVTQVDGVLDVIEDNVTGYVRDPGDVDELTAMVVRLFRAPNLIKEMGVANPKFIRKPEFSVERMVTRIADVYDRLLAAGAGR